MTDKPEINDEVEKLISSIEEKNRLDIIFVWSKINVFSCNLSVLIMMVQFAFVFRQ